MARRMDFEEYISFEQALMEDGQKEWEAAPVSHKTVSGEDDLPPGVYFLVDNSFIMLLKGKVCKTTQ